MKRWQYGSVCSRGRGDREQLLGLEWRDEYAFYRHQLEEGVERARRMSSKITKWINETDVKE